MEINIQKVKESERVCGKRSKGYYIRSYPENVENEMKPIPLASCAVCGGGIKRSRNYRLTDMKTINKAAALAGLNRVSDEPDETQVILVFVGKTYGFEDFVRESERMGISRTLGNSCPNGLKSYKDVWVAYAYPTVTSSQANLWGWKMDSYKKNPKSNAITQTIETNGFDIDKKGKPIFTKRFSDFQGFIFSIRKGNVERFMENDEQLKTRNDIRQANKGMTFVKREAIIAQGGCHSKPDENGNWGLYQDGQLVGDVESDVITLDVAVIQKETRKKKS